MINFSGLKLNRMNYIKEELNYLNIRKNIKECSFYIKLTMKEFVYITVPFKLVSSFSQLPKDLQSKRYSRGSKPSQP